MGTRVVLPHDSVDYTYLPIEGHMLTVSAQKQNQLFYV